VLCGLENIWQETFTTNVKYCVVITDDRWWCHELKWGGLYIGTDVKECSHGLIWSVMWIGKDVIGIFHDQFQVLCGLEHMIKDDIMS
jgi:hypothetical protein